MGNTVDPLFGLHAQALKLRADRLELISSNLANADTPKFKAKDLDFESALQRAVNDAAPMPNANAGAPVPGASADVHYRTARQPSLDGNTVDVPTEQAAFAQGALQYQASLTFIEARLRSLLTAITGD